MYLRQRYIHIHIYMYTYIHIHIYTYIHTAGNLELKFVYYNLFSVLNHYLELIIYISTLKIVVLISATNFFWS